MNDPWRCAARADRGARCAGLRFQSKAVSGRWRRPSVRSFTLPGCGTSRCCSRRRELWEMAVACRSCRPRLWEIAAAMLLVSTGAVGDNTRYVAHVFRRVAGHLLAVTRSYLDVARRWCGCGRWHSARCRRLLSRCRAPVGRYPIVVGTFLDAARVWEMPRGTLPTSSGALPGPCWPLPGRSWYASSRAAAVGDGTRHVAHVVRCVAGLPGAVAGRLRDISRVVHAV